MILLSFIPLKKKKIIDFKLNKIGYSKPRPKSPPRLMKTHAKALGLEARLPFRNGVH